MAGVRMGRYIITLAPYVLEQCRRRGLDPANLHGFEMKPEHVYAAGRWCNGVDLEPWNRQAFCVGAYVTLVFRDGQRLEFWWGSSEPWATATYHREKFMTYDALGEVAR